MNAWQSLTRRVAVATGPLRSVRSASAQTQVKVEDVEVRPFSEVPRPGKLRYMRSFMPGGEFSDASVYDYSKVMRQRYGDIFVQPGMFGRKDTVVTYSTSDIATVFRNEGAWPRREAFDSIVYFREHIRPDVYGYSLGLTSGQAEDWGKMRSAVNPIFMQPKGLRMYFEPLSNINNEFIERIKEIRDLRTLEVPANFFDELQRLIFESLNLVAFDRQLGIIRRNRDNPDALLLFRNSRDIFRYSFKLDLQPSMWKLVSTPTYRKMMRTLNESVDVAAFPRRGAASAGGASPGRRAGEWQKHAGAAAGHRSQVGAHHGPGHPFRGGGRHIHAALRRAAHAGPASGKAAEVARGAAQNHAHKRVAAQRGHHEGHALPACRDQGDAPLLSQRPGHHAHLPRQRHPLRLQRAQGHARPARRQRNDGGSRLLSTARGVPARALATRSSVRQEAAGQPSLYLPAVRLWATPVHRQAGGGSRGGDQRGQAHTQLPSGVSARCQQALQNTLRHGAGHRLSLQIHRPSRVRRLHPVV